jgi:hypothetical protein
MSSPRYSDRVKVFAFTNVILSVVFCLVFLPGAVLCALLGACVAVGCRLSDLLQPQPVPSSHGLGPSLATRERPRNDP